MTDPTAVRQIRRAPALWTFGTAAVIGAVLAAMAHTGTGVAAADPAVTAAAVASRNATLTPVATALTTFGDTPGLLGPFLILLVVVLVRRPLRSWAPGVLLGGVGASVLTMGLKILIGRPRPPVELVIGTPSASAAYPSGHTLNSTVVLGLIALVAARDVRPRVRPWLAAGWLTLVAGVAWSRVYLGYHWLTDVLGGFAIGVAVLALVWRRAAPQRIRAGQ